MSTCSYHYSCNVCCWCSPLCLHIIGCTISHSFKNVIVHFRYNIIHLVHTIYNWTYADFVRQQFGTYFFFIASPSTMSDPFFPANCKIGRLTETMKRKNNNINITQQHKLNTSIEFTNTVENKHVTLQSSITCIIYVNVSVVTCK